MDLNKYRKYNQSYIEVIVSPPFIQPIKALRARQHIDQIIHSKEPRTGKLEVLDETEERGSRTPKKRRSHKTNDSEQNHYYPFGLRHEIHYPSSRIRDFRAAEGLNGGQVGEPVELVNVTETGYQYKYNGKELQDELGLDWYDYGWRNYDPALGRWMNMDPLAEKFYPSSTYNYTVNNPILLNDPDGSVGFP